MNEIDEEPAPRVSLADLVTSNPVVAIKQGVVGLSRHAAAPGVVRLASYMLFFQLFMLFGRPQESGTLSFLGAVKFPLAFSLAVGGIWLLRAGQNLTTQGRIMMVFLAYLGAFCAIGKLLIDDLVRNDFLSVSTWGDIFLNFTGLVFPSIVYLANRWSLMRLQWAWIALLAYLSVFGITHGGTGPGGFIADENDVCLVYVTLIGLPIFLLGQKMKTLPRLALLATLAAAFVAIVMTASRGGFLGALGAIGYVVLFSHRRLPIIALTVVVGLAGLAFVPQSYVKELGGIVETNQGTAKTRRHYWEVAIRIWLDPKYIVQGVGINNTSSHLGDYESATDIQETGRSIAGRAVHSVYFQLLPDLGLIGLGFVGSLVWISMRRNSKAAKELIRIQRTLPGTLRKFELFKQRLRAHESFEEVERIESLPDYTEEVQDDRQTLELGVRATHYLQNELLLLRCFFLGLNSSFIGFLIAGAFISVLYYPTLWFIIGISATVQLYWSRARVDVIKIVLGSQALVTDLSKGQFIEDGDGR